MSENYEINFCESCNREFTAPGHSDICGECWLKENPCFCQDCREEREAQERTQKKGDNSA